MEDDYKEGDKLEEELYNVRKKDLKRRKAGTADDISGDEATVKKR